MRNVIIRYTLKDSANLDEVKSAIARFVAHIGGVDAAIDYTSFQGEGGARSFVHVGRFPNKESAAAVQTHDWFGEFSGMLKQNCAEGPQVTFVDQVATTR